MWWRLTRAEFQKRKGEGNKQAMKQIVDSGEVPGILAYSGTQPIAWCSIGPREAFPALQRSRRLRRADNEAVWSVVCFYVAEAFRRKGIMLPLLRAAVEHARAHDATIVEGYPVEPARVKTPGSGYMGLMPAFQQLGFVEVLRRSEGQAIMRLWL
jgi:GNAT superfamily N-acetyltransferase